MRYLLDSHCFIWLMTADPELSSKAKKVIFDPANQGYLSIVTLYELSIKINKGNLDLELDLDTLSLFSIQFNIPILPLQLPHIVSFSTLPQPKKHKDPFDRMLVAQTMCEGLTLITKDEALRQYPIEVLW